MTKLILTTFLLLVVSSAHAQPRSASAEPAADPLAEPSDDEARGHLARGRRLYKAALDLEPGTAKVEKFEQALEAFRKGAEIVDMAIFQWNLGQCNRMLGRYDQAIEHFERFILRAEGAPSAAKHVASARQLIHDMRSATKRPPTETMQDAVFPKPAPSAPAPTAGPPRAAVTSGGDAVLASPERWYHDEIGWGLSGAAAVLLGVGVGLEVSAAGLRDDAARAGDQRSHQRLLDRADTRDTWGVITLAGGAALGVAAVVRLVLVPSKPATVMARSFSVDAGLGYAGVRIAF